MSRERSDGKLTLRVRRRGVTRLEVCAAVVCVGLPIFLLAPAVTAKDRSGVRVTQCLANLRQIGAAMQM